MLCRSESGDETAQGGMLEIVQEDALAKSKKNVHEEKYSKYRLCSKSF